MKTVLCIGGTDPSGGAGIAADLRACASMGVHGACVVTATTAQSGAGVRQRGDVPADRVAAQLSTLGELGIDAVKIGMLPNTEVAGVVVDWLEAHSGLPVVLDPVLRSSSGGGLCDENVLEFLESRVFGLVELLTPNHPELEALVGHAVSADEVALRGAARELRDRGVEAVLLKGGHRDGEEVVDWLVLPDQTTAHRHPRIGGLPPRGTGCALATAIASMRARGRDLPAAVLEAADHLHAAIADSYLLGRPSMAVPHLFWEFFGSEGLP